MKAKIRTAKPVVDLRVPKYLRWMSGKHGATLTSLLALSSEVLLGAFAVYIGIKYRIDLWEYVGILGTSITTAIQIQSWLQQKLDFVLTLNTLSQMYPSLKLDKEK
jgi:hypothetical protein